MMKVHESGRVQTVSFSPDGAWVAAASGDTIKVWKPGTTKPTASIPDLDKTIAKVRFSGNSEYLLAMAEDGATGIWEAKNGVVGTTPVPAPASTGSCPPPLARWSSGTRAAD